MHEYVYVVTATASGRAGMLIRRVFVDLLLCIMMSLAWISRSEEGR